MTYIPPEAPLPFSTPGAPAPKEAAPAASPLEAIMVKLQALESRFNAPAPQAPAPVPAPPAPAPAGKGLDIQTIRDEMRLNAVVSTLPAGTRAEIEKLVSAGASTQEALRLAEFAKNFAPPANPAGHPGGAAPAPDPGFPLPTTWADYMDLKTRANSEPAVKKHLKILEDSGAIDLAALLQRARSGAR